MQHRFEEELREPVREWVCNQGLKPQMEEPKCGKIPDVIGIQDDKIKLAIEMKLSNWQRALNQALIYTIFAEECYVAMPEKKRSVLEKNIHEFNKWGVGILLIDNENRAYKLLDSHLHSDEDSHLRNFIPAILKGV